MRQIKFRGKRIDNGEWVYGYLYELPLESGNVRMILTTDNIHKDNSIEPQYHLAFTLRKDLFVVDSSTVGQFTGLYDKNSKEIYEGDIIGKKARSEDKMILHLVFYEDSEGRFKAGLNGTKKRYDFGCCGLEDERWMQRKTIIGNIYDNPEMLKE